jgi:hypothetical protein
MNLNDRDFLPLVRSIKPNLSNAIAHDIASNGMATAEMMDISTKSTDMQDLSKLIFVSSLANIPNVMLGLSTQELTGYLTQPGRDITQLKNTLEKYKIKAWYLYCDKNDRLFFKDVKNVNAELNDLVNGYSYDMAKQTIKEILSTRFQPKMGDCYQEVQVFPAIDEIELKQDKITLIITEPDSDEGGLQSDIKKFYEDCQYQNRVMFLSGQRNSMNLLINTAKQYKAMESILYRMKEEEKISPKEPQFLFAGDLFSKIELSLTQAIRETFVTLFYPKKKGLTKSDFKMEFEENNYDYENQIRTLLAEVMKFITKIDPTEIKDVFEDRLFTQRQMRWNDLKERAAMTPGWQWHNPRALEDLKQDCLTKGKWLEKGGYIDKEPPPPETSVTLREVFRNNATGEVTLKITPENGDTVYYEINGIPTEASLKVENLKDFKTKELKLFFICVDSRRKNKTGQVCEWKNKVEVKYNTYDNQSRKRLELRADNPKVVIKYTTDGSNPLENGGIYNGEFDIPLGTKFVQAVAVNEETEIISDLLSIEIKEDERITINHEKELVLDQSLKSSSTKETFELIEELRNYKLKMSGVGVEINEKAEKYDTGFISLEFGNFKITNTQILEEEINGLIKNFFEEKNFEIALEISQIIFENGAEFEKWISDRKENIDNYKDAITQ